MEHRTFLLRLLTQCCRLKVQQDWINVLSNYFQILTSKIVKQTLGPGPMYSPEQKVHIQKLRGNFNVHGCFNQIKFNILQTTLTSYNL